MTAADSPSAISVFRLSGRVHPLTELTFYTGYGHLFPWLIPLLVLGFLILSQRQDLTLPV
jgi:hypothetical protein